MKQVPCAHTVQTLRLNEESACQEIAFWNLQTFSALFVLM